MKYEKHLLKYLLSCNYHSLRIYITYIKIYKTVEQLSNVFI